MEHVRRRAGGGGVRGVLGQEAEGRGHWDLAIGAVVLSGDAGDNGVFHGNGTLRAGRHEDQQTDRWKKPLKTRIKSVAFTCYALTLLIDGVMRRGRRVNSTAQLRRLLVGRRLYELDGRLEDSKLQGHSHF